MGDRTVHALMLDRSEIVRYDRAGKWYHEHIDKWMGTTGRKNITVREAAELAVGERAYVFTGRPGGGTFDRLVAALREGE